MTFLILYPAVALLAMCIVGVIMVLLRFGPVICGVRHHALPDDREWEEDKAYDHKISYA